MKILIIFPTYNERENIAAIVPAVLAVDSDVSVLVVDDNSPDGTAEVVKGLQESQPRVHLLLRPEKQGLGPAYLAGFAWGLENGFDAVVEMDADFSHRPQDLTKLIAALKNGADFVVGSRYVKGGSTVNWGLGRKIISRGGSLYSSLILGGGLNDWTGGFNGWSKKALRAIGLEKVASRGYSFQVELKYRAQRAGFKPVEVPITFEERRVGQSKMSGGIVKEAVWRVLQLKWQVQ